MLPSLEELSFSEPLKIAEQQMALLRQQLVYVQQSSPYYRELFTKTGFNAQDCRSLVDLQTLPLTSKSDLAVHNNAFLAVAKEEVVDICQTSGTTGNPVTVWQSENDLCRLARNEQRAFASVGIGRGDRVLVGASLDRGFMAGLAYFLGLRRLGATAIRAGSGQLSLVAELIHNQRPNVLVGVPSLLLALARRMQQVGQDPKSYGVKTLVCIGEPVRNQTLGLSELGEALRDSWDAQVFGTYASTEMATAFADCSAGCGGHLLPELVSLEIVDDGGNPVPHGNPGEVVVTPLGLEATPLVRYRTGDIASLHTGQCACGRQTPRLGPILGRRAQMLKVRGTTLFPAAVSSALHGVSAVQGHYLEVDREFDLSDRLRVTVGCTDESLSADSLAELIAAKTRVKPDVVLVTPEEILRKTIVPERRKPVTFFDHRPAELEGKH